MLWSSISWHQTSRTYHKTHSQIIIMSYHKNVGHTFVDSLKLTGLTTRLRPTCDRQMLESRANRRQNVRLVAEVMGDRQGKITRSKVVVMFKTPKAPVTPAYDQVTTYLRSKSAGIVGKSDKERTTDHRGRTTGRSGRG